MRFREGHPNHWLGRTALSICRGDKDQTIVSIVGNEIAQTDAVLQKLFNAIQEIPVTMVSYGGSTHNISLLVPSKYKTKTLQLLNSGLFGL